MSGSKRNPTDDPSQDPILKAGVDRDRILELYAHLGFLEEIARAARGLLDLAGRDHKGFTVASPSIDLAIETARQIHSVQKTIKASRDGA